MRAKERGPRNCVYLCAEKKERPRGNRGEGESDKERNRKRMPARRCGRSAFRQGAISGGLRPGTPGTLLLPDRDRTLT